MKGPLIASSSLCFKRIGKKKTLSNAKKNNQIRQFQTALLLSKGTFSQNRWETSHPRTSARTRWATSPPRSTCRTRSTMSTHRSQISTRWKKFSKALFVKESLFCFQMNDWYSSYTEVEELDASPPGFYHFIIWIYYMDIPSNSVY